jgi:hypothetical protein
MRDSRSVLNDFYGVEVNTAHHFRRRSGTHDDGIVLRAGRHKCCPEASRKRQHGDKDTNGSCDSGNCDD